jgi:hypothetical protein
MPATAGARHEQNEKGPGPSGRIPSALPARSRQALARASLARDQYFDAGDPTAVFQSPSRWASYSSGFFW